VPSQGGAFPALALEILTGDETMRYKKRTSTSVALVMGLMGSQITFADDAAKPAPPAPADILAAAGITINGYVDASYQYLSGVGEFSSGTPNRVFDARHDSFTLNQAALTIAKQPKEGFGVLVNLTAGQDAEVIKSYPNTGGSDFDLTQAYVQYAAGAWTIIAGKFVTLAGAETINPTTNTNFSRSILFGYAIPFTHTGLRLSGALLDQLTVTLGVNNGWDQVSDANKQKTLEAGLAFTPVKSFSLTVDGYFGREPLAIVNNVPSAAEGQRALVDVVATWSVTDKLSIVGNYDHGEQKDDTAGAPVGKFTWDGGALYLNYTLSDRWSASLRGELFHDKDGYRTGVIDPATGKGQTWKELTLTLGYAPTKNMLLRFEGRYDKSDVSGAFIKDIDSASGAIQYNDTQSSVALEALYKF
jgi:hypothetical protein